MAIELGNPDSEGFVQLSQLLAALSQCVQSGDSKSFRKYMAKLVTMVGDEGLAGTGDVHRDAEMDAILLKSAGPTERRAMGMLRAAGCLATAAYGVVSKADSEGEFVADGVRGDGLTAMALATASEEIGKTAGMDVSDAAHTTALAMAVSAGVPEAEIVAANGRHSSGTSAQYWRHVWVTKHAN